MKHNLKSRMPYLAVLIMAFMFVSALADTIVLKDGKVLQGSFKGGTESMIKFDVNGKIQEIAIGEITSLSLNNQTIPIVTDDVGAEGGRGGTAKKVGAGALIGAAAGDAAAGAAVGGAVALLASGGKHVQVPAGTLVEVSLKQAVTVTK